VLGSPMVTLMGISVMRFLSSPPSRRKEKILRGFQEREGKEMIYPGLLRPAEWKLIAFLCIFLCVWGHAGESDTTASLEVRLQPPAGEDEFWREGKALGKIRCAVVEERDDDIVKYATSR